MGLTLRTTLGCTEAVIADDGEHVPGAAHHGDRARGAAAGDPDPHRRHGRDSPKSASPRTGATRTGPMASTPKALLRRHRSAETRLVRSRACSSSPQDVGDAAEFSSTPRSTSVDDEVFIFTPKGEVSRSRQGATPLDFAYAVHSDVGDRCVGASVNGEDRPLRYAACSRATSSRS